MEKLTFRGNIPEIIRNDFGLYQGNLRHYFRALFLKARNIYAPYHNPRHILHVCYMCYQALLYYRTSGRPIDAKAARGLMIAALFHDFDHTARAGNDDLNIEYAIRGLRANILPEDLELQEYIEQPIRWSQFPYTVPSEDISLCGRILRDADVSQALSVAWIQQVVFGLAEEWNMTPLQILRMQKGFLANLKFHTEWANQQFGQEIIAEKMAEAEELLALLED